MTKTYVCFKCGESMRPVEQALISAAPDLLAALRKCADRLQVHMKHTEDLVAHMEACKAIAKAEGRND